MQPPRGPPILPMYKVTASKSRKKGGGLGSIIFAILLPVMVVGLLVFFFLSIYMGSYYLQQHLEDESSNRLMNSIDLPNTRNIIQKWSIANLHGIDITKLGPPPSKVVPLGLAPDLHYPNTLQHYLSGNWTGSIHSDSMKNLAMSASDRIGKYYHNSSLSSLSNSLSARLSSMGGNSSYSDHFRNWVGSHSPAADFNSTAKTAAIGAGVNKAANFRGSYHYPAVKNEETRNISA